jgi:cellulose synthase (UDP-forming)
MRANVCVCVYVCVCVCVCRYDLCMLVSTNVVFRRAALDTVGGFSYGTATEHALTGDTLHSTGWESVYIRKDIAGVCVCVWGGGPA